MSGGGDDTSRQRWSHLDETNLRNILMEGDDGQLKKVLVDCTTNNRLLREDAWQRVRDG